MKPEREAKEENPIPSLEGLGIADCDRYIAKEETRSADLRPVEIQKRLDWYKEHRAKLQSSLLEA